MKTKLYFAITLLAFFALAALPQSFAQGPLAQPSVRLIYFLPKDRPARPDRIEALRQLIKDTQQFYADEIERHGYGRKTFRVETDRSEEPIVHRFKGRFNERHYYQRLTDFKVWEEFFQQVNDLQHVYLIAIDLSYEVLNEGESCGLAGVTFSPLHVDTNWFFGSAAVRHRDITPGEKVLGGSAIIPVSGRCFEDNSAYSHRLRATTHELAHAFGLDHDFSDPDSAVGGRGFRFSECDTEWLSVSRFFNSNPASENTPGNIQPISAPTYSPKGITLRFEVTDADGLHQAQLLVPEDGSWGPWQLIGCKALDGQTQQVEFLSSELTSAPERVMLQFMDDLGNITFATFLVDIASVLPPPKVVSIPDPNLKRAIRSQLGLASGDTLTDQAMKKLESLNVDNRKITNIAGLEYATQLRELFIGGNQIKNYTQLAELPNLTTLYLWTNNISDLSVLPLLPKLKLLDLNGNHIRDVNRLAGFTNLTTLMLRGNQIRDVSPLTGLVNLEVLHLQGNPIQDTSVLASLTKLRDVDIDIHQTPAPVVHVGLSERPPMYWVNTDDGTLHRLIGDEVENLASSVQNATDLAIDMTGGKLYWTERTSDRAGKIRRANLDGTNVQLVKNLTSVPHSIALDTANGKIYLTNAWGKIQRMNLDGSNFQPNLITGLESPRHLVLEVTGGKVYWTETTEASGRIRRANLNGSSVQNVATGLTAPLCLAIATGKVYWTSVGKLQRANLDGTNSEVLETLPLAPTSIAVDTERNSLYLTLSTGDIHRRTLDGSGDEPVVTGLVAPSSIVLGIRATTPGPTDAPEPPVTPVVDAATDVNKDQKVNKTDLLLVVTALGESPPANPNFDVNADGSVNIADVLLVIEALDDPVAAAAPTLGETVTSLDPAFLTMQIDILRAESDGSMRYEHAIAFFQSLLASIRPTETRLLANYPNPFNPETWIPYQLAKPADVTLCIYAANGALVRTLTLGHQPAGMYQSKSRAAYWDGKNELGEKVASGLYFYTLSTGDFTATRKMLILK